MSADAPAKPTYADLEAEVRMLRRREAELEEAVDELRRERERLQRELRERPR